MGGEVLILRRVRHIGGIGIVGLQVALERLRLAVGAGFLPGNVPREFCDDAIGLQVIGQFCIFLRQLRQRGQAAGFKLGGQGVCMDIARHIRLIADGIAVPVFQVTCDEQL